MSAPVDEYLRTGDVAAMLTMTNDALRTWRHRGIGPRWTKFVGQVRYKRSDVEAWVAEQETATASRAAS